MFTLDQHRPAATSLPPSRRCCLGVSVITFHTREWLEHPSIFHLLQYSPPLLSFKPDERTLIHKAIHHLPLSFFFSLSLCLSRNLITVLRAVCLAVSLTARAVCRKVRMRLVLVPRWMFSWYFFICIFSSLWLIKGGVSCIRGVSLFGEANFLKLSESSWSLSECSFRGVSLY